MPITYSAPRVDRLLKRMLTATSPAGIHTFLATVVHPRLARRARDRFNKQGDEAVGGTWTPLKQSTLEIKDSMGYGSKKINERTGHLRDSVVNARPVLGTIGIGQTLNFPGNWDRPDLFYRNQQAVGAINTHEPRPVVGLEWENDVAHMLTSLQAWVVSGKGMR